MRHSLDDIHGARADYADTTMSVSDICRKYRMSQDRLYYWLDGGPPDGPLHLEPIPRRRGGGLGRLARRRRLRGDRTAVIRRMWRTAEAQVRDIESRLMADKQTPDERERDARSLAILVKTLRELCALDDSRGEPASTDTGDNDDIPRDIDEFRRQLARRINAFVDERTGAGVSDS
jgi:hypothetical protein